MFTNPKYGASPSSYNRDSYLASLGPVHQPDDDSDLDRSRRSSLASSSSSSSSHDSFDEHRSLLSLIDPLPDLPSSNSHPQHFSTVLASEGSHLLSSQPPPGTSLDDSALASKPPWQVEVRVLLAYTLPIFGTHLLEYSLMIVTVISVGHLGTIELASASLASMTANVVALSVIQGICAALDTLCPQSWTSLYPQRTSLHALRTAVLLLVLFVPQALILWNSEHIFLLLHQNPDVARNAASYLRVIIFGLPGYGLFECCRRWLQAQGLMVAPTMAVCITAPINILLNFLLVWGPPSFRLGFIGAPIATAISMNIMFIIIAIYCVFWAPREAWGGFTKDVFRNFKLNISLGFAGILLIASEWWSWEIVALAASFLGPQAMAAQSVLLTTSSLTYQLAYALSAAAAVRVGNLIGAQFIPQAKLSTNVSMILGACIGILNSTVLVLARKDWGKMFSGEQVVVDTVAEILPLVALFQLADSLSGVTQGLLRGIGRSSAGAVINITAYYFIGLPFGLALTFSRVQLGLRGLWIGLTSALIYTALFAVLYLRNLKWESIAESARQRLYYEGEPSDHHHHGGGSGTGAPPAPGQYRDSTMYSSPSRHSHTHPNHHHHHRPSFSDYGSFNGKQPQRNSSD